MMQEEGIIEGKVDVERRTIYKGGMMQEQDIINGRDDAGEHYRREG